LNLTLEFILIPLVEMYLFPSWITHASLLCAGRDRLDNPPDLALKMNPDSLRFIHRRTPGMLNRND
jgi:hypothetical protein